jgi:tripartite-type tricarboxylate transporter receptor subunit TctC
MRGHQKMGGAMTKASNALLSTFLFALTLLPARLYAETSFFENRTIFLIVSGGGAYDAYARLTARYLPRYIKGAPKFVVQSFPGGGGIRAASYLYKIAPKDGSMIAGVHGSVITAPVLLPQYVDFDTDKFGWIGNITHDIYIGYVKNESSIQNFDDLRTKEIIAGATVLGTAGVDMAILARDIFKLKVNLISGYKNSQDIKLAMESGEVQGTISSGWFSLKRSSLWVDHKVRILYQWGSEKHKDLQDIPLFMDIATSEEQRAMLQLMTKREEISKPYMAPPGIPADRLRIYRDAFKAMVADPEFIDEARKQALDVEEPMDGEDLQKLIHNINTTPKSVNSSLVKLFTDFNSKN